MSFSPFELLNQSKPVLIFGRDGQVGKALQVCFKDLQVPVVFLGRSDCDLTSEVSITRVLNQYQPQVIINAAAYTAVDKAESEFELAFAVNAKAPQIMANYIANLSNGIFVQYSTDYVFADTKQTPYLETDIAGPVDQLSVYGKSKLAGEEAIKNVFHLSKNVGCENHEYQFSRYFILRASWVYGDGSNFIRAMLRLAKECDELKVVADQIGVPTSAQWLAEVTIQMVTSRLESGIYHVVSDGETSWHGLAVFAIEAAASLDEGIKMKLENVRPISAIDYQMPARRPYNSRMNNQKLKMSFPQMSFSGQYPHWQEQVETYVKKYISSFLKS